MAMSLLCCRFSIFTSPKFKSLPLPLSLHNHYQNPSTTKSNTLSYSYSYSSSYTSSSSSMDSPPQGYRRNVGICLINPSKKIFSASRLDIPSAWQMPQIEMIFKGKACSEIRDSAFILRKQLAQTAQETFGNFEEAVEKDATKTAVLDGTVHPLTSYVIPIIPFFVARPLVESGKNPQKYIKYGEEDLERMLGEFFEGKNLNLPKR